MCHGGVQYDIKAVDPGYYGTSNLNSTPSDLSIKSPKGYITLYNLASTSAHVSASQLLKVTFAFTPNSATSVSPVSSNLSSLELRLSVAGEEISASVENETGSRYRLHVVTPRTVLLGLGQFLPLAIFAFREEFILDAYRFGKLDVIEPINDQGMYLKLKFLSYPLFLTFAFQHNCDLMNMTNSEL